MDIRKILLAEMKTRGWTNYAVSQAVKKHVSKTTVYTFLNGQSAISSDALGHLLEAFELSITRKDGAK